MLCARARIMTSLRHAFVRYMGGGGGNLLSLAFTKQKLTPELNNEQIECGCAGLLIYKHAITQEFSANNIFKKLVLCFNSESFLRGSLPFSSIYLFSGFSCGSCSLVAVVLVFVFAFSEAFSQCLLFMLVRHIFEISDDLRMRITLNDLPTSKSKMEDDFSSRYATELYSIALSRCT